ncbi:uncharacterized protein MELLADRAFT_57371 [Melampsora larici-populina 98AG31]|uniref:Uncharacterized protein n=1 Tax=Melampsora larici-populina (strain 98AG31 / pathotype 3-4-7) TaxID=747676 RepID=F4S1J7_MELLP|nr:uncharacterized protein MELLADRAFT_57371 [Melampsora larici-populina 98AG31]EGG01387.1 hypothetical protein MELLADRAFT_57371 [Melampsora larici-populina 98AG31]
MEFLKGVDGVERSASDPVQSYMIKGGSWSTATLKHYNAGVSKLVAFALENNIPRSLLLPVNTTVLSHCRV